MILTFRAKKMLDRLEREGRSDQVDDKTRALILSLDGEPASDYNWQSMVNGEPLALIDKTDKHDALYVNVNDCD